MKRLFILISLMIVTAQLFSQTTYSVNQVYTTNANISSLNCSCVNGDYCYAVSGGCLEVIGVSDVSNPQLVNVTLLSQSYQAGANCLRVEGNKLYLAGADETGYCLMIFDLSTPTHPHYLGRCELPVYPYSITSNNECVYVAGTQNFVAPTLCVINCSDAENPNVTGIASQPDDPAFSATKIVYYQSTVYMLLGTRGVAVYDVSNPFSVTCTQVYTYGGTPGQDSVIYTDLCQDSSYLYVFTMRDCLRLSLANPQNISTYRVYADLGANKGTVIGNTVCVGNDFGCSVNRLATSGTSYNEVVNIAGIYEFVDIAYSNAKLYLTMINGLFIYDHAVDGSDVCSGAFLPPSEIRDMAVQNSRIYMAANFCTSIMDWHNDGLPDFTSLSFLSEQDHFVNQICVDGSAVYVQFSDSNQRVALCTTNNLGRLIKESELRTSSPITDMACGDDWLFLLREDSLVSYNMQDLAAYQLIDVINVQDSLSHLSYKGGRLFAVSPEQGMCVYRVSSIGELAGVGTFGEDGLNLAVTPNGNFAFLAEKNGEIKIYAIGNTIAPMPGAGLTYIPDIVDIAASNSYLAIMSSSCGLFIFSLEKPGEPELSYYSNNLQIQKIVLEGNKLYTVSNGNYIDIFQINALTSAYENNAANIAISNYPNPFNPSTTIAYDLRESGNVELKVYNARGQKVRTLVKGSQNAGTHSVVFSGHDDAGKTLSSGVYLYRLETEGKVLQKKMMLIK